MPVPLLHSALILSQRSPAFYVSALYSTSPSKTLWEKEKLLVTSNFSLSHSVFYTFGNFLPFSSNSKLSSANSLSLEESKVCPFRKGLVEFFQSHGHKHDVAQEKSSIYNNRGGGGGGGGGGHYIFYSVLKSAYGGDHIVRCVQALFVPKPVRPWACSSNEIILYFTDYNNLRSKSVRGDFRMVDL